MILLGFLAKERLEKKVQIWTLTGPVLLLLTLFLTASYELLAASILSLYLCLRYKRSGFYFALAIFLFLVSKIHFKMDTGHLFQFGVESSLILSILTSYLSFEHTSFYFEGAENSFKRVNEKLQEDLVFEKQMLERLENENTALRQKADSLLQINEEMIKQTDADKVKWQKIAKELEDSRELKSALEYEVSQKEQKVRILEDEVEKLREDISFLKDEENLTAKNKELLLEIEALKMKEQEYKEALQKFSAAVEPKENVADQSREQEYDQLRKKLHEKNSLLRNYEKKLHDLNQEHLLYKQLKNQFEQKNGILHQTRVELFQIKEEMILQNRKEKENENALSTAEELLMQDINAAAKEIEFLEEENDSLKAVLKDLLSAKPKKSKKKKEEIKADSIL